MHTLVWTSLETKYTKENQTLDLLLKIQVCNFFKGIQKKNWYPLQTKLFNVYLNLNGVYVLKLMCILQVVITQIALILVSVGLLFLTIIKIVTIIMNYSSILRYTDWNYDSVWMLHLIKLKFIMFIISHRRRISNGFVENESHSVFYRKKNKFYALNPWIQIV